VACEATLGADYQGIDGIVHGGIVATMLDEAMAWCLYRHRRRVYVTATMSQRYREPVPVETPLTIEARIEPGGSVRRARLHARILSDGGDTLAEGSGVFVAAPPSALDSMTSAQRAALERVFDAFAARDRAE
jgi:acyl-coenzyme A thioesterase PaaI-like protein